MAMVLVIVLFYVIMKFFATIFSSDTMEFITFIGWTSANSKWMINFWNVVCTLCVSLVVKD